MTAPLPRLQVRDLHTRLLQGNSPLPLVRGVSFDLHDGQTLALVGESGSGKSLTALSLMRLLARNARWECTGEALLTDAQGQQHDMLQVSDEHMRQLRGHQIAMIFQEPMTCLNPVLPVGEQIAESVRLHLGLDARAARAQALRALEQVEMPAARQRLDEYPHQLSGGMRQRVMIAMAMVCEPRVLIADEPTTALDVTIQAQILALMSRLQKDTGMSMLFITHNLGVVAHHAERVAVMYAGQVVEQAGVHELFAKPAHPYTQGLLACLPGRALIQLIQTSGGSVQFEGQELVGLSQAQMRPLRRQVQMVFQDPSLNPRQRAGDMLAEVLSTHGLHTGAARAPRIAELLHIVGLKPEHASRFSHEFSGGQKQRLGIARALAAEPRFIVADEPLSALDMSIQAQIVNLLIGLRQQLGLTLLFISHDLDVVQYLCDRVVVLYLGRVMEIAPTAALFDAPAHPYTQALLSAAPIPDPTQAAPQVHLQGDPPSPLNPPSGCVFRTRCPHAMAACAEQVPELMPTGAGRWVACLRHTEWNP